MDLEGESLINVPSQKLAKEFPSTSLLKFTIDV